MSESNDKKKDYLNEGPLLDLDANNKVIIDTKSGDIKTLNSDIKKPIKKTLKDYLSAKTSEQENYYKIDKSDKETSIYGESIKYAAPLSNSPNDSMYKSDFLSKNLKEKLVIKGKSKEDVGVLQNGNELLKDNNLVQDTSSVQTYLSRTLSKNRFNPENEYTKNFTDATFSIRKYKNFIEENGLIKINNSEDNINLNKDGMQITVDNMNEVAESLLLRATGKFITDPEKTSAEIGDNNTIPSVMIPGSAQFLPGIKTDGIDYDINEIIKYFEGDQAGLGELKNPGSNTRYGDSYGVLNNYFDKFSKMSVGSLALVSGIIVALFSALLAGTAISSILSSVVSDDDKNFTQLGIRKSKKNLKGFEYFKHIWKGIGEFFNVKNVLLSHGFYIIFCRSILRESFDVARRFSQRKGIDTIEYADDFVSTDSLFVLEKSKILKATNLFIMMADLADQDFNKTIIPYKFNYPGKSSLYNNVPFLRKSSLTSLLGDLNTRKKYEDNLNLNLNDGSIPFYIQDLRNDNIINFRATITDLSDSYSPQWSEDSYFGRVDPIKIYKATTRKLSISFKIFSESASDHNNMWQKIDGLTSLVYPTLGEKRKNSLKTVTGKEINYEIPYSQSFKAQPLVRIKIGDLIQNNFLTEGSLINPDDLNLIMQYEIKGDNSKDFNDVSNIKSLTPKEQQLVTDLKNFQFNISNLNDKKDSKILTVSKLKQLFNNKIIRFKKDAIKCYVPINSSKRDNENGPEKNVEINGKRQNFKPFETLNDWFFDAVNGATNYNYDFAARISEELKIENSKNIEFVEFNPNNENNIANIKYKDENGNLNWKFEDTVTLEKVIKREVLNDSDKISCGLDDIEDLVLVMFSIDYQDLIDSWHINKDYLVTKFYNERIVQGNKNIAISEQECLNWLRSNLKRAVIPKVLVNIKDFEFDINEALENQDQVKEFLKTSSTGGSLTQNEQQTTTVEESSNEKKIQIADFKSIEKNPIFRAAAKSFGRGAPAYIDSLSYKVPENYPWNTDIGAQRKPFIIDVSMDLTIIHDFVPYSNITQTRIATNYSNKKKI